MIEEGGDGWGSWRVLPRIVGGAVALPVVVGFVALGAAVLVIRSVREVMRETWALVPGLRRVALPDMRAAVQVEDHVQSSSDAA